MELLDVVIAIVDEQATKVSLENVKYKSEALNERCDCGHRLRLLDFERMGIIVTDDYEYYRCSFCGNILRRIKDAGNETL